MQPPVAIDETGNSQRRRNGLAFGEIQMHSDTQLRRSSAHAHGSVECSAVCHECRTGDDALPMRIENASAHLLGEPKIVSVDNKLPHGYVALSSAAGWAIEYLAARSRPRAAHKTVRILRIIAKE